jgi:cation:H+ antiporter
MVRFTGGHGVTSASMIFVSCAVIIVLAGIVLTKSADAIAELTGLGRLLVGSLLLAGATSLPELAVDLNAVSLGQPDLAAGDLFGSCLCNLLILAVLDLSHYSRGRMLSVSAAAHALSGVMSIALLSIASLAILVRSPLSIDGRGILGVASVLLLAVYVAGSRLVFFDQRIAARADAPGPDQAVLMPPSPRANLARAATAFVLAAAVILVVAPFLARAADSIAEQSGLGRTFVGTTLVALSTSLPELVASVAALRMGAYDLAIGNVFGSNSFNVVMLAALDLAQPGSIFIAIAPVHAVTGLATIHITAVAIAGQLYRVETRVRLIEPDALLVIILVLVAMGLVYHLG